MHSKSIANKFSHAWKRLGFYYSINWTKTIYFNFKKFPFSVARKLPVFFFGRVYFQSIKGDIVINAPIQTGIINFGKRFEKFSKSKGTAEICIDGKVIFNGYALFGKDYFIYVGDNGLLEIGNKSGMGNSGKIVCMKHVKFGDNVRISYECQVMDSNFHQMIDTQTGEKFETESPIILGNYNFLGNRVSILPGTITADYFTVASNSVCSKDYSGFGTNILIGGVPAKLLKENISRDWVGEGDGLQNWLR